MNQSTDYHDYVFRDGKLVGEFELMYRNSTGIPWHQDEQSNWVDVRLAREILRDFGKFSEIHDLGSGTGHYLDIMAKQFLDAAGKSFGYDISSTACEIAQKTFPHSTFSVLDLTLEPSSSVPKVTNCAQSRLFVIRATLWYVFPKLSTVIENIRKKMADADKLLVVQNFPPINSQFIGKEVIKDHASLIDHFSQSFSVDRHVWYEDSLRSVNDNWFIGIFSPIERNK